MSWVCPVFWRRDSNIYLVFSVFTSRPTPLLTAYILFYIVIYTCSCSSADHTKRILQSYDLLPTSRIYVTTSLVFESMRVRIPPEDSWSQWFYIAASPKLIETLCLEPLLSTSCWFLLYFILRIRRWRRNIPPKLRLTFSWATARIWKVFCSMELITIEFRR
jgi:hypothetical protein